MPLGTAIGAISLTGNSSAFPSPTPLSNILGIDDPFYAVKNLNPVILNANNPSCRYSFTYRFRIPATASSVAKLEETVWCPSIVYPGGLVSGSANLSTFAYGSFYGRAFVTANLTGVSNGEVTVFDQAAGNAELTSSLSEEVIISAIASGSMVLTSSAEAETDVSAEVDSLATLIGDALATTTVHAVAEGEAILEGESEAFVDVSAIANATMELEGDADSNIGLLPSEADSTAELTGSAEASVDVPATAESTAELTGSADGSVDVSATAESTAELTANNPDSGVSPTNVTPPEFTDSSIFNVGRIIEVTEGTWDGIPDPTI
jgi:hypothetical protein